MVEKINGNNFLMEFKSIEEFKDYLCNTQVNKAFSGKYLSSTEKETSSGWYGTKSFEEAIDLLKNGWEDMAKKLTQKLDAKKSEISCGVKTKNFYDIAGYQACVPRYLQGIPTNMVNRKSVPVKNKVITINKSVGYNAGLSTNEIMEESIKSLQIVKKLEAQGYKVNINIILGDTSVFYKTYDNERNYGAGTKLAFKVRVKSANERLNVSKLAFCMVHPSVYRRLAFRFMEVFPYTTKDFTRAYGYPILNTDGLKEFCKGEYVLPTHIKFNVDELKDLEIFKA